MRRSQVHVLASVKVSKDICLFCLRKGYEIGLSAVGHNDVTFQSRLLGKVRAI